MAVPGSAHAGRTARHRPRAATLLHLSATAYCDRGTTKAGVPARDGIVAADPRRLPLGTRLKIVSPRGFPGVYSVMDTGAEIKGRDLDIFMPSCARAKKFGRQLVRVRVLP
jgi:3D (Asp-Asp-Asp) domain-containing protein